MAAPEPVLPTSWHQRLLSRAEEWVYALNEREHWIFKLYDRGNELWARLYFSRLRRRAARTDMWIAGKDDFARYRWLTPDDTNEFAALLASFDFAYLPPHALDYDTARRVLRRRSYLPFGIYHGDELVGYLLLRLFFPKRVVLGIWSKTSHQNRGYTKTATKVAAEWTREQGLANYITVPIDNVFSLRVGLWAGWKIQRTNPRFHVLLYDPVSGDRSESDRSWERQPEAV